MSYRTRVGPVAALCAAVLVLYGSPALAAEGEAHDPHAHHRAMLKQQQQAKSAPEAADVHLYDAELVNRHGEPVRFASEVIGDRLVVMDFVYTSCTTICPVLSALFAQLQDRLGDRLGEDVFLVSVSVDPTTDTPQRLAAYAGKHGARDGWIWLTGEKRAIEQVLEGLGAYAQDFTQHPSMVLVGDAANGKWSRYYGFPSPEGIMDKVAEYTAARERAGEGQK